MSIIITIFFLSPSSAEIIFMITVFLHFLFFLSSILLDLLLPKYSTFYLVPNFSSSTRFIITKIFNFLPYFLFLLSDLPLNLSLPQYFKLRPPPAPFSVQFTNIVIISFISSFLSPTKYAVTTIFHINNSSYLLLHQINPYYKTPPYSLFHWVQRFPKIPTYFNLDWVQFVITKVHLIPSSTEFRFTTKFHLLSSSTDLISSCANFIVKNGTLSLPQQPLKRGFESLFSDAFMSFAVFIVMSYTL